MSDDLDKRDMVTAMDLAFQQRVYCQCWKDQDNDGACSKAMRGTGGGASHLHWYPTRRKCGEIQILGADLCFRRYSQGEVS
jgi:hypothetical protein